jgi:ElaB/YqjD/DUF883 family membrane-anchored ribosome-binding protein
MNADIGRIDDMTTEALRADVARLDARARELLAERPLLAVALALGAGYLLGRIVARR